MDFEFTEEQRIFREAIKNFAENEIGPLVEEAEETEVYPVEIIPKAGKLGFLCVRYPEKYGAAGTDKLTENIYIEELMRVCSGIGSGLLVQSSLGTSMILEHGTEEQKQEYLVPAIKGERISAFGLTEPNAGSDAASIQTTAVKDGDSYVINGRKIFITNGSIAYTHRG
ncbi:MAG: butyryl-CoA dehydrogenase [bacterium]|nr:MAG: butyryl-CoA dehydrogenase [bacterium]